MNWTEIGQAVTATAYADIYLVNVGEKAEAAAFGIAEQLRSQGLRVILHAGGGSFKSQMKKADLLRAALSHSWGFKRCSLRSIRELGFQALDISEKSKNDLKLRAACFEAPEGSCFRSFPNFKIP